MHQTNVKSDLDFLQAAYDKHHDLLKHYSTQVFQTRLSIVTISVLIWGVLIGVYFPSPVINSAPHADLRVTSKALLALVAAISIGIFFIMENAYFKRFLQLITILRDIESHFTYKLYSSRYDRRNPWPLSLYYLLTIIGYCIFFLYEIWSIKYNHYSIQVVISSIICLPIGLSIFAINQVKILSELTKIDNSATHSHICIPGIKATIINPITKSFAFMKHHREDVGEGVPNELTYLSNEANNPNGRLFVAYRRLSTVHNPERHVEPHTHTVDQMYCWIGANTDLTGLTVEVGIGDKTITLEAPKAVYIPAGVTHWHRYVSGNGHFIGILITEGYSYNDVTND